MASAYEKKDLFQLLAEDVGKLGIAFQSLPPGHVKVKSVAPGGWGELHEVMAGDLLVEAQGKDLEHVSAEEFRDMIQSQRPLSLIFFACDPIPGREDEESEVSVQSRRRSSRLSAKGSGVEPFQSIPATSARKDGLPGLPHPKPSDQAPSPAPTPTAAAAPTTAPAAPIIPTTSTTPTSTTPASTAPPAPTALTAPAATTAPAAAQSATAPHIPAAPQPPAAPLAPAAAQAPAATQAPAAPLGSAALATPAALATAATAVTPAIPATPATPPRIATAAVQKSAMPETQAAPPAKIVSRDVPVQSTALRGTVSATERPAACPRSVPEREVLRAQIRPTSPRPKGEQSVGHETSTTASARPDMQVGSLAPSPVEPAQGPLVHESATIAMRSSAETDMSHLQKVKSELELERQHKESELKIAHELRLQLQTTKSEAENLRTKLANAKLELRKELNEPKGAQVQSGWEAPPREGREGLEGGEGRRAEKALRTEIEELGATLGKVRADLRRSQEAVREARETESAADGTGAFSLRVEEAAVRGLQRQLETTSIATHDAEENELHSVRTELRVEKAAMRSFQRSAGNDEEALAQRVLKDQVDMKDSLVRAENAAMRGLRRRQDEARKMTLELQDPLVEEAHAVRAGIAHEQARGAEQNVAILCLHECALNQQKEIEILSGARALNGDSIYTSGSVQANAAVIKGVLKQGRPDQLTVVLPQTLAQQDAKLKKLLNTCADAGVNIVESAAGSVFEEAADVCHRGLLQKINQLVAFAPLCNESADNLVQTAKEQGVKVTAFYTEALQDRE
ncbi:unnamed protein product [Effrenium voratum]|nr:unnamed protein product [Effrenium voratum]